MKTTNPKTNEPVTKGGVRGRRPLSIKWRLFACFGAFIAFVLLVLWLFQVIFLDDFYKFIKSEDAKGAVEKVIKAVDSDDLDAALLSIAYKKDVCVLITDVNGGVLTGCDYIPGCIIHHMAPSSVQSLAVAAAAKNGYFNAYYDIGKLGGGVVSGDGPESAPLSLIVAKKAESEKYGEVIVFVNSTVTPVGATVDTLRIQIYIITAVLAVTGLVLALLFSRVISRPISRLTKEAKELAKGNYNADFAGTGGYGEISELGDTLSYAATELSKLDSLKNELVANISHDLRTPLTLIKGTAEMMRDIKEENNEENLNTVIEETERLTTLVNDILDVSKLRSGAIKIERKDFDLTEAVGAVLERYKRLVEKEGITFEYRFDRHVIVRADETRISQIVYNLINNAVIHAGESKKVTVEQIVGESYVTVGVIDCGKGIPKDELPHIWDRYYRVDKEHKRAQTGSGLGLSIVSSVIALHNAEEPDSAACGVKSEEGKGSTFWFALKYQKTDE